MNPTTPASVTELVTLNISNGSFPLSFDVEILTSKLLTFVIALGGLAGNLVVLWFLGFCMQKNAFSVYILNLAGADFLFLCCNIVYSVEEFIDFLHPSYIFMPSFLVTLLFLVYIASLSILSVISTERCLSVFCPIWYRCHRPRHMSAVMCALLWILSLLLSIPDGIYCGYLLREFERDWCRTFDFITAAWLLFLFVVLSGSSLALLSRILCSPQKMQLTRLCVTIVVTVLVFFLCGLPFGIHWFLFFWILSYLSILPSPWLVLLSCVNSSANPIIYFFVGSFRHRRHRQQLPQTIRRVLQKALQDSPEVDQPGGSLTQETKEMSRTSVV